MLVNTQGIFNVKRVKDDRWEEIYKLFGEELDKHKESLGGKCIQNFYEDKELYFIEYPGVKEVLGDNNLKRDPTMPKYSDKITSIHGASYNVYVEIPIAIFAKVKNYLDGE